MKLITPIIFVLTLLSLTACGKAKTQDSGDAEVDSSGSGSEQYLYSKKADCENRKFIKHYAVTYNEKNERIEMHFFMQPEQIVKVKNGSEIETLHWRGEGNNIILLDGEFFTERPIKAVNETVAMNENEYQKNCVSRFNP